ncbi:hypothetical protein SAMN05660657_01587 [Geodermatophilus amargosae]|uniref:Beta-lactamase class A catalytic domain-containing protein n=1 Tax=Geodermatophilus amargosae TaxID=1296565 RepID=A0A1I6Z1G2_9ACTN|nr:serine hydrolase [Geodermatophilus amargosae]SFT56575.1 hypothetical protein SAMN05660657_01587 [Geodermatophilus amargosae]
MTPRVPRRLSPGGALLPVLVLYLLLAEAGLGGTRRALAGPPAAQQVPAVVSAYGIPGDTLAVALTAPGRARGRPHRAGPRRARGAAGTARRTADNGSAATRPFPTASMVELFLAEDVLRRARDGALTLDARDWRQLQAMIRSSEDPAASEFWDRVDGPQTVRDVAARYGLTGTAPPADPTQCGETTTARDLARFLALLPVLAHPADAATLTAWMRTATPTAADGFDQRFGAFGTVPGLPAVKQGWMCCVDGMRHLHSVAVVGNRVVVLLSEVTASVGHDRARAALPPPRA